MDCFLSALLHHFLKLRFYLHTKFTYLSVQFDEFWFSFQSLWTVHETLRQPQAILTLKKNYSRWRLSLQTKGSFCRLDTSAETSAACTSARTTMEHMSRVTRNMWPQQRIVGHWDCSCQANLRQKFDPRVHIAGFTHFWYIAETGKQSHESGEFFSRCGQPQNMGSWCWARKDFFQACMWEADTGF